METRTVKLPKALINMSWLMMPMFIDIRGLFVSCQDLRDTKGTYLEAHDQNTHTQPDFPLCVRVHICPKKSERLRSAFICILNIYPKFVQLFAWVFPPKVKES